MGRDPKRNTLTEAIREKGQDMGEKQTDHRAGEGRAREIGIGKDTISEKRK